MPTLHIIDVNVTGSDAAQFLCSSTTSVTVSDLLMQLRAELDRIQQQQPKEYRQMRAMLLQTGFAATPRSERPAGTPEFPAPMAICTGVDQRRGKLCHYQPNRMVQHHIPSDAAVDALLIEFRTYLLASGIGPYVRIVTLVRSLRDGYLPRRLWRRVETSVLETLAMLLPNSEVVLDGRVKWD